MIDSCYVGDVRDGLRAFIASGIRARTCVTSPPYWGLRDYGVAGQLGLEPTIAEYVANMVEVFRLVRDVLTDDGTLWLNLGDSYAAQGGERKYGSSDGATGRGDAPGPRISDVALKPKDLCGIPWRVAFALQADGWYLRSDVIWHKPNPMPESVTDRPTKAHEYLFLLAKSERYFYDADAIAEAAIGGDDLPRRHGNGESVCGSGGGYRVGSINGKRNRRTVWSITTEPYPDAHFAVMPTALVEPCVLAGTSQRGGCPKCGKAWERQVERTAMVIDRSERTHELGRTRSSGTMLEPPRSTTLGWQPTCECGVEPVADVVLDPFLGSGTVAQVAQSLGRRWIGCELNPKYAAMQKKRVAQLGMELVA